MKTKLFLALLGLTPILTSAFLPTALAQEDSRNAYKKTWKGVASLRTLQKQESTRDLMAAYPIFSGNRRVAQVAGLVLKNDAIRGYNAFEKESRGSAEKLGLRDNMKYAYEFTPSLVLNRPRLISATTLFYQFTGGAHGMYGTSGYVFGYPAGSARPRQLKLADFFTTNQATTRRRINSLLMEKLRATKGQEQEATWTIDGTVKSVTPDQMENFVAEPNGLRWYFGPYAMGPYAVGEFDIKLTSRELGPTFRASLLR